MAEIHIARDSNTRAYLTYLAFYLIIPFCSLTSHTVTPVPPNAVLFLSGTFLLTVNVFMFHRIYNPITTVVPVCCILYFIFVQALIGAPANHYIGIAISILYFVVIVSFAPLLHAQDLEALIKKFINLSVVLLIIECIWRFTHPSAEHLALAEAGTIPWIYQYKMEGLMYSDSNGTAIHISVIFFYLLYREYNRIDKHTLAKMILLILLFFTYSRAAWLSVFLGYLYYRFLHGKNAAFYLFNFLLLILFLPVVYKAFIEQRIKNDLSFQSKFEILNSIVSYLEHASLDTLIFGVGFSNSVHVLNVYAHNFFMVYLIESGILGLVLVLLLLYQFAVITRLQALIVLIPFIIVTLSSTITYTPYLYMIVGLIYLHEKQKLKEVQS